MDVLEIYTIYNRPLDYPSHFVVRKWLVSRGVTTPTEWIRTAKSLKKARKFVPWDKSRIERSEEDDYFIVESWI